MQVDKGRFRDYPGGYDNFLNKNQKEQAAMDEKAIKQKKLDQSQIKSKSKVGFEGFPSISVRQDAGRG